MDFPIIPIDTPSGFEAIVHAYAHGHAEPVNLEQPHEAHDFGEVCAGLFHGEGLRVVIVEASFCGSVQFSTSLPISMVKK